MSLAIDIKVPPKGSRRRAREIHRQLREAIVDRRLRPGARLPSTRAFAAEFGVARNTVGAVYELLLAEGYVEARPGSGVYVADARSAAPLQRRDPGQVIDADLRASASALARSRFESAPAARPVLDLRLGVPDQSLFPFDVWRRLTGRALRAIAGAPATYEKGAADEALRRAIAAHVSFSRAVACAPDDVLACMGAQQAFNLIARTLVRPGITRVAIEDPGYPPMREAFRWAGARVAPVPVDRDGLVVERIPQDARIICVTPSHQFPTGVVMSLARRRALLDFARRTGAVIVEDDYDSEFRHGQRPLDALQTLDADGRVVYVGTFSKSMLPALRMGFLTAPDWLRPALETARRISTWHGRPVEEAALADFISEGFLARHIRRMRTIYAARKKSLLESLAKHADWLEPIDSHAGLHVAALTPPGADVAGLQARAAEAGVAVDRLDRYAARPLRRNGLAIGFGACPQDRIAPAVEALARAWKQRA